MLLKSPYVLDGFLSNDKIQILMLIQVQSIKCCLVLDKNLSSLSDWMIRTINHRRKVFFTHPSTIILQLKSINASLFNK